MALPLVQNVDLLVSCWKEISMKFSSATPVSGSSRLTCAFLSFPSFNFGSGNPSAVTNGIGLEKS